MATFPLAVAAWVTLGSARAETARKDVPIATFRYFATGAATLTSEQRPERLELQSQVLSARALYGHRFERTSTILSAQGCYDLTLTDWRANADRWQSDKYHYPHLQLVWMQGLGEPWGMLAYVVGGVASDMEGYRAVDWRVTVGAGATYTPNRDIKLTFGALYTNAMDFLVPVLPLIETSYRKGDLRIRAGFPNGLSVWASTDPKVEVGLILGKLNVRYNLYASTRLANHYSLLNVTFGPALRAFIWKGIHLQSEGGYNVRRYELERQGETMELLTFKGWFMAAQAGYML